MRSPGRKPITLAPHFYWTTEATREQLQALNLPFQPIRADAIMTSQTISTGTAPQPAPYIGHEHQNRERASIDRYREAKTLSGWLCYVGVETDRPLRGDFQTRKAPACCRTRAGGLEVKP